MRSRAAAAVLLLAAACSAKPAAAPSAAPTSAPTPEPTVTPFVATPVPTAAKPTPVLAARPTPIPSPFDCSGNGCFSLDRTVAHVRVLAQDIGIRNAGTENDRRGADYLMGELAKIGMSAYLQPFALPQGGQSWNVIGLPPGVPAPADPSAAPDPGRRYLIVGGHRDTVETAPGASDNGSGTAASVDIARAIAAQPAALPVIVVLFGAEELQPNQPPGTHHIGSRAYVPSMSSRARRDLVAFIDLDAIGFGSEIVIGRLNQGPQEASNRLVALGKQMGLNIRSVNEPDISDHGSFLKAGMNAGWIWTGNDPIIHSPQDNMDHLQPDALDRAGRLGLAVLHTYS